jgi:hypothetical protein
MEPLKKPLPFEVAVAARPRNTPGFAFRCAGVGSWVVDAVIPATRSPPFQVPVTFRKVKSERHPSRTRTVNLPVQIVALNLELTRTWQEFLRLSSSCHVLRTPYWFELPAGTGTSFWDILLV